jgi:predicted amidophosphoribosyltransferase
VRPPHLLGLLAGLVAPPSCCTCGKPGDRDPGSGAETATAFLCRSCERELAAGAGRRLSIAGVDDAWAARSYDGAARALVGALKFRQLLPVAARAAELIAAETPSLLLGGAPALEGGSSAAIERPTLVPVPADPLRRAWRGFDPAERIAAELARRTGLEPAACLRRRHGARQVGRSRRERTGSPPRIAATGPVPAHAVLVDDVVTTGATLAACAAALRAAGTLQVDALAIAVSGYELGKAPRRA